STDTETTRSPGPARRAPSPHHRRPPPAASFAVLQNTRQRTELRPLDGYGRVDSCCTHRPGQPGANNRPPDTATAASASDTVGSANRRSITAATAAITVTASANTPPAASGITGSGSTARNQTVNIDRTASARSAKRRNQPRTVSPGRPRSAAIRRNPKPHRAFAANADTITAAVSARRSSALTGNNTCVTPQPVHRDRRGHSCTGPSGPRTCRDLARPPPASTLLHDGHHNSPAASLRSTPSRSASPVTPAPPSANRRPSRSSGQRDNGRAVASNDLITMPPRHHKQ